MLQNFLKQYKTLLEEAELSDDMILLTEKKIHALYEEHEHLINGLEQSGYILESICLREIDPDIRFNGQIRGDIYRELNEVSVESK